jgi:hypothetical protein
LQQQKFRRAIHGKKPENIHSPSRKDWKLFWELALLAKEVVEFYDYK